MARAWDFNSGIETCTFSMWGVLLPSAVTEVRVVVFSNAEGNAPPLFQIPTLKSSRISHTSIYTTLRNVGYRSGADREPRDLPGAGLQLAQLVHAVDRLRFDQIAAGCEP